MQEAIVFLIVAIAAAYVGKMLWSAVAGGKSGCNGCGSSCASNNENPAKNSPLLQIELKNLNGHSKK